MLRIQMKVVTLVENTTENHDLCTEHGLSLYIETEKHRILFDTGKSNLLLENANKLNVNLEKVDTVIISHGHYDHTGGLISFLKINQSAKVFLNRKIFDSEYFSIRNDVKKNISFPSELIHFRNRFEFVEDQVIKSDNLFLIPTFERNYSLPKANEILFKKKNQILEKDNFDHELIFVIKTARGLHIFCGCAHNGILNTIATVKKQMGEKEIKTIFGGFHLTDRNEFFKTETEQEIKTIASEIIRMSNGAICYTGHCTGEKSFAVLSTVLNMHIRNLKTGSFIEIEE